MDPNSNNPQNPSPQSAQPVTANAEAQVQSQPVEQAEVQQTAQTKKTVLVVEDEKEYREVLAEKLQMEGFNALTAENGDQAIELLKTADASLILLDMLMPEMDGATFFYNLKNVLKKEIPVIILTNFTETAYPEGVADFLVKSNTSLDDVIAKVKSNIA